MKRMTHTRLTKQWVTNLNGSAVEFNKFTRGEAVSHLEVDTETHPAWSMNFGALSGTIAQRQDMFNTKYSFQMNNEVEES